MFIIHLENAPDSIRGVLSLYCIELAPYTFVSNATTKIRNLLWSQISEIQNISAVIIYQTNNEAGWSSKSIGHPMYQIQNFNGLELLVKPENITTKDIAESLWAKDDPFKSLIDHMLETGITAKYLMKTNFYHLVHRLSEISGIDESRLQNQITFICAIHDIGKAHPVFQCKKNIKAEVVQKICANKLNQPVVNDYLRHEKYAESIVKKLMCDDANTNSIAIIKSIIGLHHQKECIERPKRIDKDIRDRWTDIQIFLYNKIKEYFPFERLEFPEFTNMENEFVFMSGILGILITSDWIASNESTFDRNYTYKNAISVDEYLERKKKEVLAFLSSENLIKSEFKQPIEFTEMFDIQTPRPVQNDVKDIVNQSNLSLLLIESGCGSGKTEAALYAASVLGWKNNLSGLYMGLPTGTTAETIQSRVDDFMLSMGMDKTKIYSSKATLFHDSDEIPSWTDAAARRLIAHSAVGTVDQVMSVARNVKFSSVRLAGLSSKVLIIDELHAYDSFMLTTIIILLKMCRALNIPVILLSATLPLKTKKLIFHEVYNVSDFEISQGYPLISGFDDKGNYFEKVSSSYEKNKDIRFETLPILDNKEEIAKVAIKNIEKGGCECVIMNLVKDAVDIYNEIKKTKPDDCELLLFHSSMSIDMRDEKTKRLLKIVGKNRSNRPKKLIIVSTQLLEQSMDVDFDYMITAIAPIDLIIQRAGRYHRHDDKGTIREKSNVDYAIQVLVPSDGDYKKNEMIYEKCFLEATHKELDKRKAINIPLDVPDIVNIVYEQQDNISKIHNNLSSSKSDMGNIDISRGFTLYADVKDGKTDNKYIQVREPKYKIVNAALMSSDEITLLKNMDTTSLIDMYKKYVVSIAEQYVKEFKYVSTDKGVFKGVYIIDEKDCVNNDKNLVFNDEYGLIIQKNNIKSDT